MFRPALAVGLIWVAVGAVHALTVGNVRGVALVGKPVNVTVPITLDRGDTAAATCVEVEVQFGDSRIDSGRVRTGWVNPEATDEGVLRIQSTQVIDEPVVGVWVRAGCLRKVERRFVLLADVVSDPAPAGPVAMDGAAATSGPVVRQFGAASAPSAANVGARRSVVAATQREVPRAAVAGTNVAEAAASAPSAAPAASAPAVVRARRLPAAPAPQAVGSAPLKLVPPKVGKTALPLPEAKITPVPSVVRKPTNGRALLRLEGLPEVQPTLKSTLDLTVVPSENPQVREDARALWRALNAQADELQRDARRLQSLESQVKAAQAQQTREQAEIATLRAQLQQAEEERYANWLVGLLAALLLVATAGAGFLWLQSRKNGAVRSWSPRDWWHGSSGVEPSNLSDLAPVDGGANRSRAKTERGGLFGRSTRKGNLEPVQDRPEPSVFDSLKMAVRDSMHTASRPDSLPPSNRGFVNSMSARTVNVEELFDIQQQADFFVSLGQHEQAIELLRQHIYTNSSTSGMAYLDLLQIYHKFERRQEYDQLRDEFNRLFNAQVPPFDQFGKQQRRGLERYPSAMARLEAMWKSPRILSVLQESIFRRPEAVGDEESFDLEAYRELLLLFAIAKDVVGESPGVTPVGHDHTAELDEEPDSSWGQPKAGKRAGGGTAGAPATASGKAAGAPGHRDEASPERRSSHASPSHFGVSVSSQLDDIPLPKPSPRLGVDVNLFDLESGFGADAEPPGQPDFRSSSFGSARASSEFGAVAPPDIGHLSAGGKSPAVAAAHHAEPAAAAPHFDLDISSPNEAAAPRFDDAAVAPPAGQARDGASSAAAAAGDAQHSLPPLDFSLSLLEGMAKSDNPKPAEPAEGSTSLVGDLKSFIARKNTRSE